eukprot:TRINITY_DN4481_c0_g3_i1.p1 TRINITY_DN4481_c0_g3~~TRINITY_DN4481_c0_g3_i1.p1  ORF type:complete len:156 (+),score=30.91 TRINITY_DN4481_c0_g3_i1:258-725(+)
MSVHSQTEPKERIDQDIADMTNRLKEMQTRLKEQMKTMDSDISFIKNISTELAEDSNAVLVAFTKKLYDLQRGHEESEAHAIVETNSLTQHDLAKENNALRDEELGGELNKVEQIEEEVDRERDRADDDEGDVVDEEVKQLPFIRVYISSINGAL